MFEQFLEKSLVQENRTLLTALGRKKTDVNGVSIHMYTRVYYFADLCLSCPQKISLCYGRELLIYSFRFLYRGQLFQYWEGMSNILKAFKGYC